jgi:hypothetical protein
MKSFVFCLGAAGALAAHQDTAPPVISLDLEAMDDGASARASHVEYSPSTFKIGVGCSRNVALCRQKSGTVQGFSYVEKYSRTCDVGIADATNCYPPDAHAYDHQEGSVSVTKTIKLINRNNVPCVPDEDNSFCVEPYVTYSQRAEYGVEYDAQDATGNAAERLIFTIILVDHNPPSIVPSTNLLNELEACDVDNGQQQDTSDISKWIMPSNAFATDDLDGNVSNEMVITITSPTGVEQSKTQQENGDSAMNLNTYQTGVWTVKYTAKDHAGHFGVNGQDNEADQTISVLVKDSVAPWAFCKAKSCAYETGKVPLDKYQAWGVNEVLSLSTVEECCHECEMQQVERAFGSNEANHAPKCGFFSFDEQGQNCYLMRGETTLGAGDGLRLSDDDGNAIAANFDMTATTWKTGYPIQCQTENEHECGEQYTDPGARCIDLHDSYDLQTGQLDPDLMNVHSSITSVPIDIFDVSSAETPVEQTIQYSCTDNAGRTSSLTGAERYVVVTDTQAPTVSIDLHHVETSAGVTPQSQIDGYVTEHTGFTCTDHLGCDPNPQTVVTWHNATDVNDPCGGEEIVYNTDIVQRYAIKYTCTDHQGHQGTECLVVDNQDKTAPVISLNDAQDGDEITVDAAATGFFSDNGATCFDHIDGQINENLVIQGANIRLNRPGDYLITYNCADSKGLEANQLTKTVHVVDEDCPTCTLNGDAELYVEAGYEYTEQGAVCTDDIGHVVDGVVETNLPVEVEGAVDVSTPDTYTIVYKAQDGSGNWNDGSAGMVDNGDGTSTCHGGNTVTELNQFTRTVHVDDSLSPVITLSYTSNGVRTPVHIGNSDDVGHGAVPNRAGDEAYNPYLTVHRVLMAEAASSMNGWLVGALASATAGLALLGYASRRPAPVTTVPV